MRQSVCGKVQGSKKGGRRDSQWAAAQAETQVATAKRAQLKQQSMAAMAIVRFVRFVGAVRTAKKRGVGHAQSVENAQRLLRKHSLFAFG